MSLNHATAIDAILGQVKAAWDANTAAITPDHTVPHLVYEFLESDLKPHPKDTSKPWARAVVRHSPQQVKATLKNSDRVARYRRYGIAWVQVFVPQVDSTSWLLAQQLAIVARNAYEGKRGGASEGNSVVFTSAAIVDQPLDGAFVRVDVKALFYWDEIK